MNGSKLLEFIISLKAYTALTAYDQGFLLRLDELATSVTPTTELSIEQLKILKIIFNERWAIILDTPNDYTFKTQNENLIWIKFSQKLAKALGKNYLQILIPTVVNTIDPNTHLNLDTTYNLRDLFLGGEDNDTLFSIDGILKNIQKGDGFVTNIYYKDSRKQYVRSVSLLELFRIQSKQSTKVIILSGSESYSNFKTYLDIKVLPNISNEIEIPRYLLNCLLNLVESYYICRNKPDAKKSFRTKTLEFAKQLNSCHFDEVNCLYSQEIKVGTKAFLLSNVLLDCINYDASTLSEKLLGLVRWIAIRDGSLISESRELDIVYRELKLSKYFALDDLKSMLLLLSADSNGTIKESLLILIEKLQDKSEIDGEVLSLLQDIYESRWHIVKGSDEDYTRLQGGVSKSWIKLAQILSGARLIPENYYRYLMTTLTEDNDPVQKGPTFDYPLSHFILSSDNERLIYLENSLQQFIRTGVFLNCNTIPPVPYDMAEIELIKFAHPRYHKYIKFAQGGVESDPAISRDTVLAVYELVNNSFFPDGLWKKAISEDEVLLAENAYKVFGAFLDRLDEDERDRLFAQRIILGDKTVNFLFQLKRVEEWECIAGCSKYFAKLVMDYNPSLRFRDEIEAKVAIDDMRANSAKKVFSDLIIDDTEAKRRILVLAADLMCHVGGFNFSLFAKVAKIWDCSNTMVDSSMKIFDMIMPLVNSSDFKHARHTYAMILEMVVNPSLRNLEESLLARFTTFSDTWRWLSSIKDSTLFIKDGSWFDPKKLIIHLVAFQQANVEFEPILSDFIVEFIRTYAQPQTDILKEVRINVKFKQFLNSLTESSRINIVSYILSSEIANDQSLPQFCARHLINIIFNTCATSLSRLERSKLIAKILEFSIVFKDETSSLEMVVNEIANCRESIELLAGNSLARVNIKLLLDKVLSPILPLPPRLERQIDLLAGIVPAEELILSQVSTKSLKKPDGSSVTRSSTPIRSRSSVTNSNLDHSPLRPSTDLSTVRVNLSAVTGVIPSGRETKSSAPSKPRSVANSGLSVGIAGASPKSMVSVAPRTTPPFIAISSSSALPPLPPSKARGSITLPSSSGAAVSTVRQVSLDTREETKVTPLSIFSSIKVKKEEMKSTYVQSHTPT